MAPGQEGKTISDPRFSRLHTDPRFVRPKKHAHKPVLDDRFKAAFEGQDAGSKAGVDRFGKKVGKNAERDDLRRFYRLQGDDGVAGPSKAQAEQPSFIDFARGQVLLESSDEDSDEDAESAEEEESEESSDEDGEVELGPKSRHRDVSIDLDETAPIASTSSLPADEAGPVVEPTRRIAVVNMDWDNLLPSDLFAVFSSLVSPTAPDFSLLPPKRDFQVDEEGNLVKFVGREEHRVAKGRVEKVTIYKSKFGKERMAKEDLEGPPKEIFKAPLAGSSPPSPGSDDASLDGEDDDSLVEEASAVDYDETLLRTYQLSRLRYFFAVVELSSVSAARHVYEEVEGTEFERTANVFDLSYVPDGMVFEDEDVWDECTEAKLDYKGVDYVTDALRHSKVKLTWDAEDPHRSKITRLNTQKLTKEELDKLDYGAYIASGSSAASSDDDDDDDAGALKGKGKANGKGHKEDKLSKRDRMRKLMGLDGGSLGGSDSEGSMEITFTPAFAGSAAQVDPKDETSLETYKRREKERRERKKAGKGKEPAEEGVAEEDEGFDDHFFKDGRDMDDAIAAREEGALASDDEDAGEAAATTKKARKQTRDERQAAKAEKDQKRRDLEAALGEGSGSDGEDGDGRRHFNMNDIIRAEKLQGKKKKHQKGQKAKRLAELKDGFEIDAQDQRFKSVFEEPDYAIDPSNPHFKKTKNMDVLLSRAQQQRLQKREQLDAAHDQRKKDSGPSNEDAGLSSLVASIKRKAQNGETREGKGKRRKA